MPQGVGMGVSRTAWVCGYLQRMRLLIILLLLPCVTFGQLIQETNTSQAVRRLVAKNYLLLPKVCGTPGTPDGLNYSANDGAVVADTCNGNIKLYYNGSWITIASGGSGITSLNGLTGATQTFATGTSGTDFNINSTGTTHTFNIPDASASARGLITTGAQTIAGAKVFNDSISISPSLTGTKINLFRSGPTNGYGFGLNSNNFVMFATGGGAGNFQFRTGGQITGTVVNTIDASNGGMTVNGAGNITLSTGLLSLGASTGARIQMFSTNYGFGINASDLAAWVPTTGGKFSFRFGGTVSSTQGFAITGTGLVWGSGSPAASAMADFTSTTQGFLPPRMTSTQRNAISSPATGLSVYNSTDGTNDVRVGSAWYNQPNGLKGSAALNFGNTAAQTSADLTITITGAADGDHVILGVPNGAVAANTCYTAWVSAANTVTVRFNNYSAGAVDPASATFKVYVIKN